MGPWRGDRDVNKLTWLLPARVWTLPPHYWLRQNTRSGCRRPANCLPDTGNAHGHRCIHTWSKNRPGETEISTSKREADSQRARWWSPEGRGLGAGWERGRDQPCRPAATEQSGAVSTVQDTVSNMQSVSNSRAWRLVGAGTVRGSLCLTAVCTPETNTK